MKITLLDTIPFDYHIDTPLHQPLGAGNSAICYLSKELAQRGHTVTVINGCYAPSDVHGIAVRNHNELTPPGPFLNTQDVVVVHSGAMGHQLRQRGVDVPLVLWTQHAADQPAIQPLRAPVERYAWNAVVYVSEWQRKGYEQTFAVPPDKARVIHNGVAPPFETVEKRSPFYYEDRPPVLCYTSTPFRGLQTLLSAFPRIRKAIPGTTLEVYSSMKVYQKDDDADDFDCLYHCCQTMDDVYYYGSMGQGSLAAHVSDCDVLTYPSIFAEGQCVSIGEAMAAGLAIFTTTLGALPEFYSGHAVMTEWTGDALVKRFADDVIDGLRSMQADPIRALANRSKRIAYALEKFHWPTIATQWETMLQSIITGSLKIAS